MRKIFLYSFILMSMSADSFGMRKDEVLAHLNDCVVVSEDLKKLIQHDDVLTHQEWDSFYKKGGEQKWGKICKKRKGEHKAIIDVLRLIYGEYFFQKGMHYQNPLSGQYNLSEAIEGYSRAADYGHIEAKQNFIILGIKSHDLKIKNKAVEHAELWLKEANDDCLLGDATVLNTLGVYYEIEKGNIISACHCYAKAVELLTKENCPYLQDLNAWKNLDRLKRECGTIKQ